MSASLKSLLIPSESWSISVLGEIPRPQGSMRHVGGGRLIYADTLIAWRERMRVEMTRALPRGWITLNGPVHLDCVFAFNRPDKTPKYMSEFPYKGVGSDLDKLVRAVGDSLESARVVTNDSRIASISAVKGFCPDLLPDVGVQVRVIPFRLPTHSPAKGRGR